MITVLIADDHPVVRSGLKEILSETPDIVVKDEASNGSEVIDKIHKNDFDVLILDISMPDRSGLDILDQLQHESAKPAALILSIYPEEQYAVQALKAGASGYLTKQSTKNELVTAIRTVASGQKYITASLAQKLADYLREPPGKLIYETLSNREFTVMCLIASGKKISEIAKQMSLSPRTISTYHSRILKKMKMKSDAQLIHYCIQHKLIELSE